MTAFRHRLRSCVTSAIAVGLLSPHLAAATPQEEVRFSRDIRPILTAKCYACHGPDEAQRQAGLRLDSREDAVAELSSGATAVVPGRPHDSELVRRIFATDGDEVMPPREVKKPLTDKEKNLLRRWVEQGAEYEGHWAFRAPVRPGVPEVRAKARAQNEIDRFILNRLEAAEMEPSPEADRVTLVRRVSLDVRGLPPTPDEVRDFVQDPGPDAYANLVDRMLASPHYGERRAQDWLDLARYGDSNGYHSDSERDMWIYRDYVIDAFNAGKGFDRFIVENIAGDLLPDASTETRVASGFNRCNTFNEEGGADPAEFSVAYAVDRANTTGQVFLGLTFGCAQCHDHKYDPISQKEYYQFYAFFNSLRGEIGAGGITGHHGKPLPPLMKKATPEQEEKCHEIDDELRATERKIRRELKREGLAEHPEDFASAFEEWTASIRAVDSASDLPLDGLQVWLDAADVDGNGVRDPEDEVAADEVVKTWRDRSPNQHEFAAEGNPKRVGSGLGGQPTVRLDGDADHFLSATAAAKLRDDFSIFTVFRYEHLSKTQVLIQWGTPSQRSVHKRGGQTHRLGFGRVSSSRSVQEGTPYLGRVTYTRAAAAQADATGEPASDGAKKADDTTGVVRLALDGRPVSQGRVKLTEFEEDELRLGSDVKRKWYLNGDVAEVLIYDRPLTEVEELRIGRYLSRKYGLETTYLGATLELLAATDLPPAARSATQRSALRDYFLQHAYEGTRQIFDPLNARRQDLMDERATLEDSFPTTMVMLEKRQRNPAYVLMRGDFQQPGERVLPDVPAIFPRIPENKPRNRLGLAHWLTRSDHPLVSRVTVNRIWKQFFGTGIVKTMGDFGSQGEWPSHPDLIEWLAVELVESGWDVKALERRILLSATYRQSSRNLHLYDEIDPYNRLLSRAPRFRLSAEEIRDVALAIGGLLETRVGGDSVKPYQPLGYYGDKIGGTWKQSAGSDLYRRGLYTFWRRTILYPAYQIFDAPSREVCAVDRPRTNTPLQALTTLNDVTYVEAARVFAERLIRERRDVEQRLRYAFRLAVARSPTDAEFETLSSIYEEQRQAYAGRPDAATALATTGEYPVSRGLDPNDVAVWTGFCNVILNLDEVMTRE